MRRILHNTLLLRKAALRSSFYHEQSGHYDTGMQGGDAYAVWCGIAGEETARLTAQAYEALGHFDTGFMGTDVLLEVLFEHGFGDTALKLLQSRELGSFLYMKDRGATTVWENWSGAESHNHPMFAGCARHLFTGLLGIRQRPGTAGWRDLIISPCALPEGESISASLLTPQGKLTVSVCGKDVQVRSPQGVRVCTAKR